MAYKFQKGAAKLAGTIELPDGLVSTGIDDTTAANVIAQVDNKEIPIDKLAVADAKIIVGNAGASGSAQSVSGDATMNNSGLLTIANNAVTLAKMDSIVKGKIIYGDASGDPAYLAAGADNKALVTNGAGVPEWASVDGDMISDNAVGLAQMDSIVKGKIIYGDASGNPAYLAAGADNRVLATNGAGVPVWVTVDGDMITADAIGGSHIGNDQINSEHYAAASIDNEHLADGAVDTEELANNAVTLAKMAGLVRGKMIAGDSNGDPVAIVAGDNTKIFTANASGDPSWQVMSGDATINAGALTIANTAVENGMLVNQGLTIGTTQVNLGGTANSLAGLQGIQFDPTARKIDMQDSAHDAHANGLTIKAGKPTAGTTANKNGGSLTLEGGQGKGTGTGGSILFRVSTASGSSDTALNPTQQALAITQDKNAQFAGNLTVDGDLTVSGTTVTLDVTNLLVEDKIIQVAKAAANQAASKDSGLLFGRAHADGAQLLYEVDSTVQMLVAKQGTGSTLIKVKGSAFIGPCEGNATTATDATNFICTDNEATDEDCLIVFVDGPTGAQGAETDGDLSYNPSTGTLTATSFVGSSRPAVALKADGNTLAVGVNYLADMGSNGQDVVTLPASPSVGDIIYVKAPSDCTADRSLRISRAGSQTIDGVVNIDLVSANAAVSLFYVAANKWKIF